MSEATTGAPIAPRLSGTVRIVGAGLLGSSIGHALSAKGVDVVLHDSSPAQLRLAIDYGAGRAAREGDAPRLIVVAVPPDVTAQVIESCHDNSQGYTVIGLRCCHCLTPITTSRRRAWWQ